ncbi:Adenine nucleotide translocator 1 [Artemisia annua]|uniref:Adenine nucleotide translocator 1 n=1 Tax=Artemisia annua TaxID=35608 RepID=A0A2U1LLF9_ARTAN|nr:Adenine nucleotide translocator 1 [Artemisia annua]
MKKLILFDSPHVVFFLMDTFNTLDYQYKDTTELIMPERVETRKRWVATSGFDLYRSILRSRQSTFLSGPSANFIAGAAAGCTTLVIIYPLDIAHT